MQRADLGEGVLQMGDAPDQCIDVHGILLPSRACCVPHRLLCPQSPHCPLQRCLGHCHQPGSCMVNANLSQY
jgi:hypothetical protein